MPPPGSISEIVPSAEFATQTLPSPYATAVGPFPTLIVSETSFVAGSIRETVPSAVFATHTAPGLTATPDGEPPT